MKIAFTKFTESLSAALDYAEKALLDVDPLHGMRVAVLTNRMARRLKMEEETSEALTQAAALHDCALSEYFSDESSGMQEMDMAAHCSAGEKILESLPFYGKVPGAVLYHHERADGRGAFGRTEEETPLWAQLIHTADVVDVRFSLYSRGSGQYREIREWIRKNRGTVVSAKCADAFLDSVDTETLDALAGENARAAFEGLLPERMTDVSVETLREMASVFAVITDYKSHFTWRHSIGIAEKAEVMGRYYRLPEEECGKLYIAGALHDIGKLLIRNTILEKPGKLTAEEYSEIRNHAVGTWELLHGIAGLEDITRWAALHHEKLDGSGYPFGYTAENLDRNSRLMACLDIYQALVEERPYKAGLRHDEAMRILRKMENVGQLDGQILDDIDGCFGSPAEPAAESAQPEPAVSAAGTEYRCPVCGYRYAGELPEDFICPRCEQPASVFEKVGTAGREDPVCV